MANRWGNNGNSDRLFSWAPKSPDGDCIHEIKRHLLLGRKVMTKLDSVIKSRDVALPTKIHPVKAMVFLYVMDGYEYERCTIKKVTAENWMLLNCGVGEDACRSLRLQGDATTPS